MIYKPLKYIIEPERLLQLEADITCLQTLHMNLRNNDLSRNNNPTIIHHVEVSGLTIITREDNKRG